MASLANIGLDILFVSYFQMGVSGAAWATNLAQLFSFIVGLVYMMKKYPLLRWKRQDFTFDWTLAKRTLKAGVPMALQQFIVSVGFVFIQRAVNSYGEAMTSSFTVAQKIETYLTLSSSAFMTTQGTYTGQNIGANQLARVKTGAQATILLCEMISICLALIVFIWAKPLVAAFGLRTQAVSYCTSHIRFVAWCLPIFASYFPLLELFQGANDALFSTFVATMALAIRVSSTYLLQKKWGYPMIWWNTLFGWGIGAIITWMHFLRGKWLSKTQKETKS